MHAGADGAQQLRQNLLGRIGVFVIQSLVTVRQQAGAARRLLQFGIVGLVRLTGQHLFFLRAHTSPCRFG